MNKLCEIFSSVQDGETVLLDNRVYDVYQDDCFVLSEYYCSNTASKEENPDGTRFVAVYLKDKNNITIDGKGATIKVHGVMTPMLFDGCKNITVKNLTIDYARPTMSEFRIVKRDKGVVEIDIPKEFLFDVEDTTLVWKGETGKDGKPYWQHSYKGKDVLSMFYDEVAERVRLCDYDEGDTRPSVPTFTKIERLSQNRLRVYLANEKAYFPEGNVVQTRNIVRNQVGSFFVHCKNLTLQNVRVCAMHGLGLLCQYCENVTYDKLDCTPKQGRTIVSNADFFHFSGCKGMVEIKNCKAWGAHDDFINVHGTHLRIIEQDKDNKRITVRFIHSQTWGFDAFSVGDEIEYVRHDTLIPYAKATVVETKRLNDTDILLTLSQVLPTEIELGKDVVENASNTPSVHIHDSYFGVSAGRGVLCTTRGSVRIENNVFYHTAGAPLVIEDDCNFWFESGYTTDVQFIGNKIIGCGYGFKGNGGPLIQVTPQVLNRNSAHHVHGKLTIKKNVFEEQNKAGYFFQFEYIDAVWISGNVFDAPYRIEEYNVGNIYLHNNLER